jgi:ubiquinone/menaquinone biosynthesis C-methylase UbiE
MRRMTRYIHGETDAVETERLEKQARFLSRWILEGVEVGPGARLLDLACGVGAMARRLRARLPDVVMVGSDLSLAQLRAARKFTGRGQDATIPLCCADAAQLPFRDRVFDAIHCSWLLEHVPGAAVVPILREARRVLAPRGRLWLCEVENESLAFWPRLPLVESCFDALWDAQVKGGGDPNLGRKLHGLCREAGFHSVLVTPTTLHMHRGSPAGYFRGVLAEFAEILESGVEVLPEPLKARSAEAVAQLLALEQAPGGSFTYTFFRARAEG